MMHFSFSNIGKRPENQDLVFIEAYPDFSLFLLADGMGGYKFGANAAQIAIENIVTLINTVQKVDFQIIQKAVNKANLALRQFNSSNNSKAGCTLGGAILFNSMLYSFWIGDVRILHFKNNKLVFESIDHTMINQLKNSGSISDVSRLSKYKHVVTRSLNGDIKDSLIDNYLIETDKEDNLLILCSDGVHDVISSFEIQQYLQSYSSFKDVFSELQNRLLLDALDNNSLLAISF